MNTPVRDMLEAYLSANTERYHMPGHKGRITLNGAYDVTEIPQSDDLYSPQGALKELETTLAERMGSKYCLAMTDGSSAGVRIICAILARHCRGKRVLIADCPHRSTADGCILADLKAELVPLDDIFDAIDDTVGGVLITSPDYYGKTADIKTLSEKCRRTGTILAVDEAHGAHLAYIGAPSASRYADISVQSMHKTMGALTQAATLCINDTALLSDARLYRRMLCTSSPSFIILESMEQASNKYAAEADIFIEKVKELRQRLTQAGVRLYDAENYDITRLCVICAPYLSGYQACKVLADKGIVAEMADNDRVVFILTPWDTDYQSLIQGLTQLTSLKGNYSPAPRVIKSSAVLDCRSSALAEKEYLEPLDAIGRTAAVCAGAYPPGVPCVYPGHTVTREIAEYLTLCRDRGEVFGLDRGKLAVVKDIGSFLNEK